MTGSKTLHGFDVMVRRLDSAPDSAPLVVFVHGMMEAGDVWTPLIATLGLHYRCVVLDLPWNGRQGGFWGQQLCPDEWLHAVLDAFELEPDAWVAHSFGASTLLALMASRQRPGLAAPAVLISPFYKASASELTWPLFQHYVHRFTDFVESSLRSRLQGREPDTGVLRRMTEAARDAFGCYVWMQFWQLFSRMPFVPVARITQPILTLTGADDFSSVVDDVRALDEALPNGQLEIYARCGHFVLSSHAPQATTAISRFLAGVCPVAEPSTRSFPLTQPALPVNNRQSGTHLHGYLVSR